MDVLLENAAFVAELEQAQTVAEAVALFAREGVVVSEEELNSYLNSAQTDDLSEDDLADVSGGCLICVGVRIIRGITNSRNRSSRGGGGSSGGGGAGRCF